jgi:hypothetical protein
MYLLQTCQAGRQGSGRNLWALALVIVWCAALAAGPAVAATIYANPGDSITTKINSMSPGDTLILNPGTYTSTIRMTNKNGDASHWFTIHGSDAGHVKVLATDNYNMIETRNSSFWRLENFEMDGNNYVGSDGIHTSLSSDYYNDYTHDLIMDGLEIHHFNDVCVSTKIPTWNMTVRNCHIHDTIVGLYMGNSDGYAPIINFTLQHCWIERCQNYNMQIKAQLTRTGVALGTTPGLTFTSWGWLVKDNVFMRDPSTALANRPNLLVDAAPMTGTGSTDLATIDGNVVLAQSADPLSDDSGFQLAGNLVVTNNVIMNVKGDGCSGIRIGQHQAIYPRTLTIVNNTVFIDGSSNSPCLSLWDLQSGYTQVIANNALIRGDTSAIAVSNGSIPAATVITNNIVRGTGALAGMTTITTPLAQIFVTPNDTPGVANLYPIARSPLIDAGSNTYATALDFNGAARPQGAAADVGAYERYKQDNPGWQLADTFKNVGLTADVNADGHVDVVDLLYLVPAFGAVVADAAYNPACDFNKDGSVDVVDLLIFVNSFGL